MMNLILAAGALGLVAVLASRSGKKSTKGKTYHAGVIALFKKTPQAVERVRSPREFVSMVLPNETPSYATLQTALEGNGYTMLTQRALPSDATTYASIGLIESTVTKAELDSLEFSADPSHYEFMLWIKEATTIPGS